MTDKIFNAGDRVFDDVICGFGSVYFSGQHSVNVRFDVETIVIYLPNGQCPGEGRVRLHRSNPAQEIFEKINEAFNKGEKE